ncbi:MAG: Holliday junction branch migration DNA helicase RuvB [Planctomycetota bacterium]
MATERLLSPETTPTDVERAPGAGDAGGNPLRPTKLAEYVGQRELIERLSIAIEASRQRGEPIEHLLLHGPPGLGKTTLAHVIANEMGSTVHATSGPALARGTDLVATLTRLQPHDVLFIDEIHRLPIAVEEFIYPAMEDFRIDVTIDSGLHAQTVQIKCPPFTLIGATTRAGLLSSPLRSRFGLAHHLQYYDEADLLRILSRSAEILGVRQAAEPALHRIGSRSRGTPRIANRLLRRVRDYADVRADGVIEDKVVDAALELEGIDAIGLDEFDRAYLRTMATTYQGGPVGLEAIAATMNQDPGTLEDMIEPFLLQSGFLARTRRGRTLTQAGADHIGVPRPPSESEETPGLL